MSLQSILLQTLGFTTFTFFLFRLSRFLWLYARPSSLSRYHHGSEPWALVTGASDGIGKSLATELSRYGFNVVLHGRNARKLETVATNLQHQFPQRKYRTAVLDAGSATHEQIEDLVTSLEDIHLTILINNVAGGQTMAPLTLTTAAQVDLSLNCNARFPAQMTRALLSRFARAPHRSLILNIGSAAHSIAPYASVYGGSKACNMGMSSSLSLEMVAEGLSEKVEILAIVVGLVAEAGGNTAPVSLFAPPAREMAKMILRRVGCGREVVVGGFWHAVQLAGLGVLPMAVTRGVVVPLMRERWERERRKR